MGNRFEIDVWQRRIGRNNGEYGQFGWDEAWRGNSRIKLLIALVPLFVYRHKRPLRMIYR